MAKTQKIVPHLWYDKEAVEAAELYASVFPGSKIKSKTVLSGTPSGTVEIVNAELSGHEFILMSAGPLFKFNPSVSFLVCCKDAKEVDRIWGKLSAGGKALMELGAYPFSQRYGWIQDRYGLSWQIMHMGERPVRQRIVPTMMFVGDVCGKAEEAMNLYASVFRKSEVGGILRYGEGEAPDKAGTIKHASFTLEGQEFAAMDSAHKHEFAFNEAISFLVNCDTQKEIDYYWGKLSADPKAEQCGWLKDKYGLSWQVNPPLLGKMIQDKDPKKVARVTKAFLKMKKLDISALKRAYEGK